MVRKSAPFTASTSTQSEAKKKLKQPKKSDYTNAYTFLPVLPKRHRTSTFQNSLSHEERELAKDNLRGKGRDLDNDESMQARIRKVAMMIADDDAQEVEEESEIDSDEAWESGGSDEERWGDIFRDLKGNQGKKKAEAVRKPAKPLAVNLHESDDDEKTPRPRLTSTKKPPSALETNDEDADLDISDVKEENDQSSEDEESQEEEDESEMNASDGAPTSDFSDTEEDAATLVDLNDFVEQLAASDKKRKVADENVESKNREGQKKRKVLPLQGAQEIKDNGALRSKQKLDISDLTSHPALASASSLLKSGSNSTSVLKQGILAAPLPTVQQERLDREAAYAQTKSEGQKWAGVMKRVKEAEHLSFPLQAKERGGVKSGNEILAGWKPQNDMESAIDSLLRKANLTEDELTRQEDLQMEACEMNEEEIRERRAQLRYQRELLFRAEAKAKRVAKIKSKTFRKLARKRAAKDGNVDLSLEDLDRLNPEAAEAEREKMERARALERATLRHGAKKRWTKDLGGAVDTEDNRMAKEQMLDMKEKLLRKIHGQGEDSSSQEESEIEEDGDEQDVKSKAFEQLTSISSTPTEAVNKGLMSMKFMQKAQERKMRAVAELEKDARQQIELFGTEKQDDDEDEKELDGEPDVVNVGGNEGRIRFIGPATDKPAIPVTVSTSTQNIKPAINRNRSLSPPPSQPLLNPWLNSTSSCGPSRKKNASTDAQLSSEAKAVKALKKAGKRKDKDNDEQFDLDINVSEAIASQLVIEKSRKTRATVASGLDDDAEDSEIADLLPNRMRSFQQKDLVAEAFAGDNVVEDFAIEKAKVVEADAPKVEDTSLPGWGSWGGKGAKRRKINPKFLVKTAGIEPSQRKDFTSSNVIITEKKDRKAAQFQLQDLPYPYTSKEQYEKSFSVPVGGEWNSRGCFQRGTLPKVVKKPGAIIEPIRRLF
ncbi:hypothetical protein L204_104716 [Cryptococcus depauperatus]